MFQKFFLFIGVFLFCTLSFFKGVGFSYDGKYAETKMSFENFVRCELTRNDAPDYFNGKPFKIIEINMYDVRTEGDVLIVSGIVKCWVVKEFKTLFVTIGVKKLLGHNKVYYLLIKKHDFSVLATQLEKYPYKEQCPWAQYWIDLK